MSKSQFFNKHYLFVFTFSFVVTFSFVGAFYANDFSRIILGFFYGLIFIPMFFFFRYRKDEIKLGLLNLYMFSGFFLGFLFSVNEVVKLNELTTWSLAGIPFAIAFNLFCIKILQAMKVSEK